ncbi:MAG: TRIC cation channel family protein [Gammaproteobacteria bacterium]|nr:TRIC cation channel family protein [Gammaproteobacteria bacterium]
MRWLLIVDALGLGLSPSQDPRLRSLPGSHGSIAILMGITTGVAGGVIRDVLCNEVPLVMRKEIYALAALAGSGTYVLLDFIGYGQVLASAVAFLACAGLRLAAIRWKLSLPTYGGGATGSN